jgi:hypothetical protein
MASIIPRIFDHFYKRLKFSEFKFRADYGALASNMDCTFLVTA